MGKRQTRGNRNGVLDVEILRTGTLLSAHQTRHLPLGADPLPVGVPSNVGVANAEGNAEVFARQNHVHNHPAGLGFTLHHNHYSRILPVALPFRYFNRTFATGTILLSPIQIPFTVTVDRIAIVYDTVAAGNIRAAIYRDNGDTPAGGALVVESASVAKTGIDRTQEIAVADTVLIAGLYWLAWRSDENTTTAFILGDETTVAGTLQTYYIAGGYGAYANPCPAVGGWSTGLWGYVRVKSVP